LLSFFCNYTLKYKSFHLSSIIYPPHYLSCLTNQILKFFIFIIYYLFLAQGCQFQSACTWGVWMKIREL
jgi:hypothetical protein